MAREIIGEAQDILRSATADQLKFWNRIRKSAEDWRAIQSYVFDQNQIQKDKIYRLRRPKSSDEMLKNAIDHEYYSSRVAALVVLLQVAENAGDELERRSRKEK